MADSDFWDFMMEGGDELIGKNKEL